MAPIVIDDSDHALDDFVQITIEDSDLEEVEGPGSFVDIDSDVGSVIFVNDFDESPASMIHDAQGVDVGATSIPGNGVLGSSQKRKRCASDDNILRQGIPSTMTDEEFDDFMSRESLISFSSVLHDISQESGYVTHINLKPRKTVELRDGTFLYITRILNTEQGIKLRGRLLILQNRYASMLPKCKGEVLWKVDIYTQHQQKPRVIMQQTIDIEEIKCVRKVIFTNTVLPMVSRQSPPPDTGNDVLYCRRLIVQTDPTKDTVVERAIENLRSEESDLFVAVAEDILRTAWRGLTTLNGSDVKATHQRYTIGDCFCGCGGVSRGAKQAGLSVKFGFDMDKAAMASYRANFAQDGTIGFQLDVSKFLDIVGPAFRVDILHLSPPCQPYSAAHTTSFNILKDEQNQAVLFSTWHLIEKLKPRIVTMEETEGLYCRHPQYFYSLVHTFMAHGYSVKWKIVNTYHYGVPQSRRRIYLFAAGPGERLPSFPDPTHGEGPGLQPFRTIADTIYNIPRDATHHDTRMVFRDGPRTPYPPNRPAFTLTCGGGENNYHPSGRRRYTVREMAALQTFPHHHSFADNNKTAASRQIGNAVPPRLAEVFLRACVESLMASDRAEMTKLGHTPTPIESSPSSTTESSDESSASLSPLQRSGSGNSADDYILLD